MKILGLKNIYREESYIYYRRKFSGTADFEVPGQTMEANLDFIIETDPFGRKTVEIQLSNALNYPVLPLKKALQDFILIQDSEGKLP